MTAFGPNSPKSAAGPRYGLWAAQAAACLAGAVLVAVAALMAFGHVGAATDQFFASTQLDAMRGKLVEGSETYDKDRQALRQADQELRQQHQWRLTLARRGGWVILGAAILLVASVALATSYRKRRPVRRPKPEEAAALASRTRWLASGSVAGILAVLVFGGAALALWARGVSLDQVDVGGTEPVVRTFPTADQIAKEWPRFRGPEGSGIAAGGTYPTTWDAATGQNILWKTPLPMPGMSSPVVWGNRIFMTGAVAEHEDPSDPASRVKSCKMSVFCVDADTGKLLWQKFVETTASKAAPPPKISDQNDYAVSTPVTDGQGVFAMFPNGDIAAFDMDGKPLWTRAVGPLANSYGHATGLEMYHNFLLIQLDQGLESKIRSAVLALDAATGKTVWETRRSVPQSWATPILIHTEKGDQFVTAARPLVAAYDPETGKELWSAEVLGGEVAPSPIFVGNTVYVACASSVLTALRTDGTGDVTGTGVLWKNEDSNMPDIVSPLCDGKRVWLMTTEGRMTCFDAKDGKKLYEKEFAGHEEAAAESEAVEGATHKESAHEEAAAVGAAEGAASENTEPVSFLSSPGIANGHVYLTENAGITHILAPEDGKELSRGKVGETVRSSLVFLRNRIYIRGQTHLFCIGTKN